MRGLFCIILFSECLHARSVLELPRECGTVAHCVGAESLCVKIKDQRNATVNHHVALDKCQLQLLKCQPGHVEAAPVPMKFCQGDQLSKDAAVVKKRVRRHLERPTTESINKTLRHGTARAIQIGRSNVEKNSKSRRKRGRSLKQPSKGFGAARTQKKYKTQPKSNKNVRISKGKRTKKGGSTKRKPLVVIKLLASNIVNHKKRKFKGNKKRVRPHVPGSLAAPLDYGSIKNPNDKTRQGYADDMDADEPVDGAVENGEGNQGDVGDNEGDGGVNEGDNEADEGDRGVNEGDGGADEGEGGVNGDDGDANEDGGVNEGGGDEKEGDGEVNEEDREVNEPDEPDEGDGKVNGGDAGENEGDGEVDEDREVNEPDDPDEGDREVNEEDGGANEGDGDVNDNDEGREVANKKNTDNVFWKGDNDEGDNADNVEGVGENVETGNDGKDNVKNEGANNGENLNDMIARVKNMANPGLWNSISNGLRGVSMKFNLAVNT